MEKRKTPDTIKSEGSTCDKYSEVKDWLDQFLKSSQSPRYEINEETYPFYYSLMQQNKQRNEDLGEVIKKLNSNGHEYELELQRFKSLIHGCGITSDIIEPEIQLLLHTLAEISITLDLKTLNETNFLFAVDDLKETQMNLEVEINNEHKLISKLQKKTKLAQQRAYELQTSMDLSNSALVEQEQETEKLTSKSDFLPKKVTQYDQKTGILKSQLLESGLQTEFRHETLLEKQKELMQLDAEINSVKSSLSAFCNLPPDVKSTEDKLNQVKQELAHIEELLKQRFSSI